MQGCDPTTIMSVEASDKKSFFLMPQPRTIRKVGERKKRARQIKESQGKQESKGKGEPYPVGSEST
jgi:hypothetical protein